MISFNTITYYSTHNTLVFRAFIYYLYINIYGIIKYFIKRHSQSIIYGI